MDLLNMRIAFLNYSAQLGGAEHSLLGLLSGLNKQRFEPLLIHAEEGPLIAEVKKLGIATFHLPFEFEIGGFKREQLFKTLLAHPFSILKIKKWINQLKGVLISQSVRCIHANQPKSHFLAMLAGDCGIPYILHIRDIFPRGSAAWYIYQILFSGKNGHAVAISNAVFRELPGKVKRACRVVYNGVSPGPVSIQKGNVRERLGLGPETVLICAVGRLVPWKGFELLIQSFSEFAPRFPRVHLVILGETFYGDPSYRETLLSCIRTAGVEGRVHLPGYKSPITDYLAASEFLVHPSDNEPFGRVLIEAMAQSKPVVAFRTGGIPEIITHKKTGYLVDPRTSGALCAGMRWILEHPEESRIMGVAARDCVVTRFSLERHVREMETLFGAIVN
jgi:glycosyltransferase involved in cell wall biosynthesis